MASNHSTARSGGRRRRNDAFSASASSVDSFRSSFPATPSSVAGSTAFDVAMVTRTQQQEHFRKHHWGMHYWVDKQRRGWNAVWVGRILVVIVLVCVASMMGFLAFTILTEHEQTLAETQFHSISQRALTSTKVILESKRYAGVSMAKMAAELYPNASQWPFVEFLGFERLAKSLLDIARSNDMTFVPYVLPEQLQEFEAFAISVYDKLGYSNSTGRQGVWAWDNTTNPPTMYHDTSAHKIMAPVAQTDKGDQPTGLLFNMYSQSVPGQPLDRVIACTDQRKLLHEQESLLNNNNGTTTTTSPSHNLQPSSDQEIMEIDCGASTDLYPIHQLQHRWGAGSIWPIYPIDDPFTHVGHITTMFLLDELLENIFAMEISGIDAIFETDSQAVSFTIEHGVAHFVGEGKHYDPQYESRKESRRLLDESLYPITLTLVPNEDFYKVYQTSNPGLVTVGAVLTILMASLVFFLYDSLVRREFNAKKELLEARRQFMRFVSHEVRTPLNAVSMGLDLMQSELAQALGFESPTSLRASHILPSSQRNINTCSQRNVNIATGGGINNKKNGLGERHGDIKTLADLRREFNNPQENSNESTASESNFEGSNESQELENNNNNSNQPSQACLTGEQALEWFQLTQEIQGNTQGAVDILNDILNYDKIEQGTLKLALEVISVWELLETATLEFKLPASSKDVQLDISFGCCVEDLENTSNGGEEMHAKDDKKPDVETLKFARAKDLPPHVADLRVIGDSVRLTQVLRNFCSNALKFTPEHGSVQVHALYVPPKEICASPSLDALDYSSKSNGTLRTEKGEEITLANNEVVVALSQGCIKVRVTDTGAGMTPDQLSKLFQDGVQFNVNELQAGQGSGLGLYIAKGIVEQHEGIMSATSEGLGQGTTFEMELPLWKIIHRGDMHKRMYSNHDNLVLPDKRSDVESGMLSINKDSDMELTEFFSEEAPSPVEEPKANVVAPPSCLQVLIVDDVMSNRKLLKRLLERSGHQCDEAENGQVAVQMVERAASRQMPYDSILLDYEMPVMDGPTAAKEIRRLGFHDVFMVGITGNVLPEDIRAFKSCGANDVLAKPVKLDDLYAAWMEHGVCSRRPPSVTAGATR